MSRAWDAVRSIIEGRAMPEPEPAAEIEEICPACEGGGWVQCYSPRPPAFEVCRRRFNPQDHPSP